MGHRSTLPIGHRILRLPPCGLPEPRKALVETVVGLGGRAGPGCSWLLVLPCVMGPSSLVESTKSLHGLLYGLGSTRVDIGPLVGE